MEITKSYDWNQGGSDKMSGIMSSINQTLMQKLRTSPIKFKKNLQNVQTQPKTLAIFLLFAMIKRKLYFTVGSAFELIISKCRDQKKLKSGVLKITIHKTSKYLKSNCILLLVYNLLGSVVKNFQFRLLVKSLEAIQNFQRSGKEKRLINVSVYSALTSLLVKRKRYALDILKQNTIEIFYISKIVSIEAKRAEKRIRKGNSSLLYILKSRLSAVLKRLTHTPLSILSLQQEYILFYLNEIYNDKEKISNLQSGFSAFTLLL